MLENIYFEELKNDVEFLESLKNCEESYRVFHPFLKNDFMDIFATDEESCCIGISGNDVQIICRRAGICPPIFIPCQLYSYREKSNNNQIYDNQSDNHELSDLIRYQFTAEVPGRRFCIGVGHYDTKEEGQLHMCVLIDLYDRMISSISFSDTFDAKITEEAITHAYEMALPYDITIHSSRNKIYQTSFYQEICDLCHVVMSMTERGTRGGIMPVSQFFSNLKRELGNYEFFDQKDAIYWLSCYILKYNLMCSMKSKLPSDQ